MAAFHVSDTKTVVSSKQQIIVSITETDLTDSDSNSEYGDANSFASLTLNSDLRSSPPNQRSPELLVNIHPLHLVPHVNVSQRMCERMRLAHTFLTATIKDSKSSYKTISKLHRFSHKVVNPLFTWRGDNTRVLSGKCLGTTTIQDEHTGKKAVIHAASHNYVGFYTMTDLLEQSHKLALERLPIAPKISTPALLGTLHQRLANFFGADFCYITSTGYGSNILAFPAVLQSGWLCIMDSKSHNSMFVGAFMSNATKVTKFRHNDMSHLETILNENHTAYEHIMVAVEGLYSMDGTIPPLDTLARLKQQYGFVLLVDEAHSLLSVGKTGKGVVEMWNDSQPKANVADDLIDIRTATLSKSLGSLGGMVCGKARFQPCIATRRKELQKKGADPTLSATLVQCLHVLDQPTVLQRRLSRMHQMSLWARSELKRFGVHVYGDAITPMLPIHTGRPSSAAELSYRLREHGILATPVSIPAVPFWQARVRVCLSADHTDAQINTLIRTIISDMQATGVIPKLAQKPHGFESLPTEINVVDESAEAIKSSTLIKTLIAQDANSLPTESKADVIQAGHKARHKHGLASGGARWISGTFSVHIEVEELINESLGVHASLTYADSYIGLLSTVSALCRPLFKCKAHNFIISRQCPQAVPDGIKVAPRSQCPMTVHYDTITELHGAMGSAIKRGEQITVYLPASLLSDPQDCLDQPSSPSRAFFQKLGGLRKLNKHLTFLLHDTEAGLSNATSRSRLLKIIDMLQQITPNVLVFGSFMSNFDVPGAYLAGSQQLIEELRYTSRGYMFTTAPLPFVMGIVKHNLEAIDRDSWEVKQSNFSYS